MPKTTVRAGSNIAFIKYWGVDDPAINLPQTSSISMTLADAHTTTTVAWDETGQQQADSITIDGRTLQGEGTERLVRHLDRIRELGATTQRAQIASRNNFPLAAGIASSASGFAALTVAACRALGLTLSATELSALARRGSGSASRSVFGGFVLWERGQDDATSVAHTLHEPEHWSLMDLVAIVSRGEKKVSSAGGHRLAATSPLNCARVDRVQTLLPQVQSAVAQRDLSTLGECIELDTCMMHGVMQTGSPSLLYWEPGTLEVMHAVRRWREEEGLEAYFTIDAGPNVHVICDAVDTERVHQQLMTLDSVQEVLISRPGPEPEILAVHEEVGAARHHLF